MANITAQNGGPAGQNFDDLLQTNEARYEDSTSTVIQGANITALNNFAVTTPSLASDSNASNFTADNCFINLTDTTSTTAGDNWLGGSLNLTNSTVNYSGGVGGSGIEYPGFRIVAGTDLNDRYVVDFNNSTLLCSRNNNARWTLHFQGAALAGHNLTNTTFGFGVVPYFLFGMADLIGVTFSGQSADTVASHGTGLDEISICNMRIDNPNGTGGTSGAAQPVYNAEWWGLFGCDFRNWTDVTNVININQTTFFGHFIGGSDPFFFVVDGQFSQEILANGFRLGTDRGNYAFISGVSFNPLFRDNITTVPLSDAIQVDFAGNTIWEAQPVGANANFDTLPTVVNSAGVVNVNGAGQNGYIIQINRNNDQVDASDPNNPPRLAAPRFTNALNYWSYTHQSYAVADGANLNIIPTARAWTNSFQFADTQNIDLVAETALNSRDLATATGFIANGLGNLNDVFPMLKALYYNSTLDTNVANRVNFPFGNSTPTEFNTADRNVTLVNSQLSDSTYTTDDVEIAIAIGGGNEFNLDGSTLDTGAGTLDGLFRTEETFTVRFNNADQSTRFVTLANNINNAGNIASITIDGGAPISTIDYVVDPVANNIALSAALLSRTQNNTVVVTYDTAINTTISNGTLNVTSVDFANGLVLGTGVTLDDGQFLTVPNVDFNVANNPTIRFADANVDLTQRRIGGGQFTPIGIAGGTTITVTSQQASDLFGLTLTQFDPADTSFTGVTIQVAPDTTFEFSIDAAFRGRVGFGYRDGGLTGSGAFTHIEIVDYTVDQSAAFPTIDTTHPGLQGTNNIVIFTTGANYVLNTTEITITSNANQPIRTQVDGNVNMSASIGSASLDVIEQFDGTAMSGKIDIVISGAATTLSGAQTNALLATGRNDVDYVTELLDGGLLTDYITFPTDETSAVTVDARFIKADANTPQQAIRGVEMGFSTRSIDGTTMDVLNFPSETGLSLFAVQEAFNNANAGINRGVSYTVGQLDRNPIIQAPTGSTYETSGGNAVDYPDLT